MVKDNSENLVAEGRIILKLTDGKYNGRVRTGFMDRSWDLMSTLIKLWLP
jgi:hypothetical protein